MGQLRPFETMLPQRLLPGVKRPLQLIFESDLTPNSLQLVCGFSCCFAMHTSFFVLLSNEVRQALFVFPYLPVEIGMILPCSELRRLDGFCACV